MCNLMNVLTIPVPVFVTWAAPYGPAVINGILTHHGYNTRTWDMFIDMARDFPDQTQDIIDMLGMRGYRNNPNKNRLVKQLLKWTTKKLRQKILEQKPDVVILSVFSSYCVDFTIPLTVIVKKMLPDSYLIVGGRGLDNIERRSNRSYGELYARHLPADCVYMGDAENNLVRVIQERYKGFFKSPQVTAEELEATPPANWAGYEFEKYDGYKEKKLRLPVCGSKGCVRACTFCNVPYGWPKYIFRDGESIAREVVAAYQKSGINKFEFTDNLINGSIPNYRKMIGYLADHVPDQLDWLSYFICRPETQMKEEDFSLAKKAGASWFKIGIESGSERIRHEMRKKFSNDDIRWTAEQCFKNKITQQWLLFPGYPSESEQDFQETLDLLQEHRHMAQAGLLQIFVSLPMLLTDDGVFMNSDQAEIYGLEHNRQDDWSDFFWTSTKYTENTWQVRSQRWKNLMRQAKDWGYTWSVRNDDKFLELDGLDDLYQQLYEKNGTKKKTISINKKDLHIVKDSHV